MYIFHFLLTIYETYLQIRRERDEIDVSGCFSRRRRRRINLLPPLIYSAVTKKCHPLPGEDDRSIERR
ncbi:hypothetical protein HanPI659440_Chr05g0195401 [Helianthus annuus]|nr:hypothetical protein HanPI659440_Chr05g0195401 [Helianthus annuus]